MLTRHIRESLQVTPGPFPDFWAGPEDKATVYLGRQKRHSRDEMHQAFPHRSDNTASDQKLDSGKTWGRGYNK